MTTKNDFKLPPVICSLFMGHNFIGTYDTPYKLLDAIDEVIGKKFIIIDDIIEDNKLRLFFSVVNDVGIASSFYLTQNSISKRTDIKKIFDDAIEVFEHEYQNHEEEDDYENNMIFL